jgi:hypothetical protein
MGAVGAPMGLATGSGTGSIGAGGTAVEVEAAGGAAEAAAGVADGTAEGDAGIIRETFFEMNAVDFAFRAALPPGS